MTMKYNFDKIPNRRGTNSLKWDVDRKELPMWVADMDFETVPEVQEALVQRVAHGVYGYSVIPDEWADSYVNWWEKRHHFRMDPKKLIFTTGVIPALSSAVRKLTTPAENVLIQTPVYNNFFNSIRNNGRNVVENELLYDGKEYRIDWEKLEQQLADPQTTLMILCNPQNPAGNIWDRETLARIGALCKQYDVIVVSDEIHCDLTKPGTEYIPFASVDDTCRDISVTCIAPTKTFNLAGLQTAAVYAENSILHHRMWRQLNTDEVAEPNAFAIQATIAAFQYGEEWLDELREYMEKNKQYVTEFLQEKIPLIHPVAGDAYYELKQYAPCRLGIGKAGARYKTLPNLEFRAAHSAAQDAVFNDVDQEFIDKMGLFTVQTQCESKDVYLTRPDLGRKLNDEAVKTIKEKCKMHPTVQIYVSDGLSSAAIAANVGDVLPAIEQGLKSYGIDYGTPFFVKYGRVGAMDQISEITGADVTCVLIGERPGLITAESMSAYIAYKATVGMPEARRTVVSNIHKDGTIPAEAGAHIADIIKKILDAKASGTDLKL